MQQKLKFIPHTKWTATSLWSLEYPSLSMLFFSLIIVGIGEGVLLLSNLGSAPWTTLSQGIAIQGGFSVGWASFFISCAVMLAWLPLRLKMGIATLLNVVVIAFFLGLTTSCAPVPHTLICRFIYALIGVLLFGIGTAFYLTCHQGAGPRDGLMVGLCQRFHWKVAVVRTTIEVSVCLLGWLLGGVVGIGTLLFALSIGWVVQVTLLLIARSPFILEDKPV
ncbi:hypothetical protein EDC45_0179 [Mesocricetibacter intestinalis]|uniref:Membrane protein YczE n=1 Tax=Mesocricetibacter intestinalis TaxID=1521930 RepID=A0A4R6VFI2_9PAST|nr:YitT family protein [Mesocricetibacter intestinalis]TDQ59529.1 hypothetical protein EDC45_0179 [Mesocricetibacter intestinalis]